MTDSGSLILYDISSPLQPRSYAPNPSKARLALSFKSVLFTTTWVDILDIPNVRKGLNCPATRSFDDGSDFFTLPILQNGGEVVGDSFDIANYLEDTFPGSGGCLFPLESTRTGLDYESPNKDMLFLVPLTSREEGKNNDYARFNVQVDVTFTAYVGLVAEFLPFNLDTTEATRAVFLKRARLDSWDKLSIRGGEREEMKAAFKTGLTSLAQLFMVHESGPYLEGKETNYADLIVGGWLNMLSATMPQEEICSFPPCFSQ
ncbi:hypothetical protein DL98DRAFT_522923 [Cadophora sp. DSE1049]|nr:hypothetical protein DL98DRAFT_522923 [Cadophora sp. DSE1049]